MTDEERVLNEQIGAILRERREEARLSQADLGATVGQHQVIVSRVERGVQPMAVADLPAYARALGVPVVRLLPVGWRK